MKTIIIIQARMGSERLPNKVLLPLGKSTVLDYVVNRCSVIEKIEDVIVATSELSQDDRIATWCEENYISCFRGSEQDVLSRYVKCAEQYEPDYVIRVTADCPFVDYEQIEQALIAAQSLDVDIVLFKGNQPRGFAVELISYKALRVIDNLGKEERHREHVTYYGYEHIEDFNTVTCIVPSDLDYPNFRVTLDTYEDYEVLTAIANTFESQLIPTKKIVEFLINNPVVANINSHIVQKLVR